MQNQPKQHYQFILRLFDQLIHSKRPNQPDLITKNSHDRIQDESFFSHFKNRLQFCKKNVRNLCFSSSNLEEPIARKIINSLLYLNKDIWNLLQDGTLNLYIDLVEMKQKFSASKDSDKVRTFLQGCIREVEPLLYEFFAYKEYKKINSNTNEKQRKGLRTFSLVQQVKITLTSCEQKTSQKPHSSTFLFTLDNCQVNKVRQSISQFKINELLSNYLNDYEMEINELEETCKICSKKIKINHLQQHVQFCQKKYILKQDICSSQNKIINLSLTLIQKNKTQNPNQIENYQQQNLNQNQNHENLKFIDFLYEILNYHKLSSMRNQTSKKVQIQSSMKQNSDKYQQILQKMESFQKDLDQKSEYFNYIQNFISLQKQIIKFANDLRSLESEHQNLRQITSSSTICAPSSLTKISQKKSRFASKKNKSKSTKNCRQEQEDFQDQDFVKMKFSQSDNQIDQESNPKTKKSLENEKNVHFNVDSMENDQEQQNNEQNMKKSRKQRKIKSMAMFDSDSQEQKQISQKPESSEFPQEITLNDFDILKFLGKGAFGKVYVVRKKNTTDLYALKMIDIDEKWGNQEFQQITNEHEIFKKVAGQHLVQAPYCFSEGSIHVFMMQFMPGGDLGKVLEEEVYLEEQRAKFVLAEIVLAIQHLHNADIIHRDLKPQNLVIDEKGHLKLTDFGLSEIKIQNKMNSLKNETQKKDRKKLRRTGIVTQKQKAKLIGTPDYIAPQIINSISINNKSIDWWSLGVIAYQILIGARPFSGNTIQQVVDNILKLQIQWPQIGEQDGMISQDAHDFIKNLLTKDFINRLGANSVEQIKSHPFFKGIDWQSIKHETSSITPNYAKIKQLLEMEEDKELRKQIFEKTSTKIKNSKSPQLDNFIRFDILGQKTVKDGQKLRIKKKNTLKRLQSINNLIADKENEISIQE